MFDLGRTFIASVERSPNAWCRAAALADYKRPRDYIFVAEIPKSPVGKILRRLLVAGEYRKE